MILPIYAYGQAVLKKDCADIEASYENLSQLIENMWATMYHAQGVGLAAPQVGLPIRLFIVDTQQMYEKEEKQGGLKRVFINARMIEENGDEEGYEEGCLSIPDIRGEVQRQPKIRISYFDENFKSHEQRFQGLEARVIQHEYDHIDGILFTEKLKPIKRRLIRKKLENIRKGKIETDYKMRFSG